MISLLYVDDEPGLLELGKLFLEHDGEFEVSTALSGEEGLVLLREHNFDAVVSDFQMPVMNGIALLKEVRKSFGTLPFILFTGRGREEIVIEAINNGVDFYLQKGGDPKAQFAELAHKIRQAVSRRQAETALSDSERRLADIISFLPDATFAIDTNGVVIAWNLAMERMTGVPAGNILGRGDYEYALPFYRERRPILINLVLENDPAIGEKYPFVRKDGKNLISEITIPHFNDGRGASLWFTASPLYDRKGGIVGAIESIRDITERKRAEEELVAANTEYTNLLDQIQDVYYRSDAEGRLVRASRSWATVLGYADVSECIGKNIADDFYANPSDRARMLDEIARNGKVTGYEVRLKKKDGTPVFVEVSSHASFDAEGRITGVEGTFRDVTDRKKAEGEKKESETRFRELAELLPQGVYEADIRGRMSYVNRMALEMFGYTAQDIAKGVSFSDAIAPADRERAAGSFYRMAVEGSYPSGSAEYLGLRKDGTSFPVAIYSSQILRDGRILGVRGIVIDITEQKKADDELRAVHEQLVASDEELRAQYDELALGERRIRMSETRLRYMLGFDEYAKKSEKELLEYAIEGAGIITESALAYLAFLNDDESELSMYAWSKSAMAECSMREKPIVYKTEKTGLWGEAVRQRQAVITNDYAAPNTSKKGYPEGHPRIIRHLNVPVIEDGHVILVAGVANKPSDYTENDANELLLLMQGLWNILRQRRAEATKRESEEKYRNIIDHTPAGMHFYELRPDGSLVFSGSNPGADRILGIDHRRFIGMTLEEAFPPLAGTEIAGQYRRVARDGGMWQTDQVIYDGEKIHGAYAVTAFRIAPGRMVASFMDITERKKGDAELKAAYERVAAAEEKLRQQYDTLRESIEQIRINEERLVMAQEIGHTGSWEYSLTRKEIWASAEALKIFGIHRDAGYVSVDEINALIPDRERSNRALSDLIYNGKEYNVEYLINPADGSAPRIIHSVARLDTGGPGGTVRVIGVIQDITGQKQAEAALRESEEKYRMLVESAFDGIAIHQDGILVYVNKTAARLLGSDDVGVFIGKAAVDIVSPELREKIIGRIRQSPETAVDVMHEELLRIDGTKLDAEVVAVPGTWKGRPAGIVTFRDIAERKRSEEALRENEEKFRTLVEINRDIIYSLSSDGIIGYVSPQTITQLGYGPQEMEGRCIIDFVHPDDAVLLQGHIGNEFVPGTAAPSGRFRVRRKDGTYRWFEDTTIYTRDSRMRPIAVGTIRDITEEKAAQDALRESEERLKSILNTAQAGIVIVDARSHTIVDANKKALELIGLGRDAVIGAVCHRFICPADEGKCPVTDLGQQIDTSERVLITAAAGKIPVLKTVVPVSISGRDVLVESFVDISEQKRSEAAIREVNRKLNLLNNITRHDIRNQLTVALGNTQLAGACRPDPAVMDFLARITTAIETIQRQIEFTKEYQELGVHAPSWFRLADVVGRIRAGRIPLRTTCGAVEIFADPMIDKVFFNLFDNALKYGETVTAVTVGCGKKGDNLVITVADNGIGIPEGEKQKIFEKGYGKNTGLGLFLAREILAITGMTIRETGTPGEGAVFEITVPEGTYRNME